ncbi:MAG: hypothetical protein AB7T63_09040 [Planctomycetota bacterium]
MSVRCLAPDGSPLARACVEWADSSNATSYEQAYVLQADDCGLARGPDVRSDAGVSVWLAASTSVDPAAPKLDPLWYGHPSMLDAHGLRPSVTVPHVFPRDWFVGVSSSGSKPEPGPSDTAHARSIDFVLQQRKGLPVRFAMEGPRGARPGAGHEVRISPGHCGFVAVDTGRTWSTLEAGQRNVKIDVDERADSSSTAGSRRTTLRLERIHPAARELVALVPMWPESDVVVVPPLGEPAWPDARLALLLLDATRWVGPRCEPYGRMLRVRGVPHLPGRALEGGVEIGGTRWRFVPSCLPASWDKQHELRLEPADGDRAASWTPLSELRAHPRPPRGGHGRRSPVPPRVHGSSPAASGTRPATLDLRVVDAAGSPIPFAEIAVDLGEGTDPWTDIAGGVQRIDPFVDAAGQRTLHGLPFGPARIHAWVGSALEGCVDVDLEAGLQQAAILVVTVPAIASGD